MVFTITYQKAFGCCGRSCPNTTTSCFPNSIAPRASAKFRADVTLCPAVLRPRWRSRDAPSYSTSKIVATVSSPKDETKERGADQQRRQEVDGQSPESGAPRSHPYHKMQSAERSGAPGRSNAAQANRTASQLMKTTSRHAAHSRRGAAGSRLTLGAIRMVAITSARRMMIALAKTCRTTRDILL